MVVHCVRGKVWPHPDPPMVPTNESRGVGEKKTHPGHSVIHGDSSQDTGTHTQITKTKQWTQTHQRLKQQNEWWTQGPAEAQDRRVTHQVAGRKVMSTLEKLKTFSYPDKLAQLPSTLGKVNSKNLIS